MSTPMPMRLPAIVHRYYEGPIWSTVYLRGRQEHHTYRLFSVVKGQFDSGKCAPFTHADTSMQESEHIGSGLAFTAKSVLWTISAENPKDLDWLIAQGSLQWRWLNTSTNIAPLSFSYAPVRLEKLIRGEGDVEHLCTVPAGDPAQKDFLERLNEARRELVDTFDGSRGLYRGGVEFTERPVVIPANTSFNMDLLLGDQAQPLEGNALVRVYLFGMLHSASPGR